MIQVQIYTPEGSQSFSADRIFLPGTLGEFEVLRNHAPIISTLSAGQVRWFEQPIGAAEQARSLVIKGGVVRLRDNEMQICAEI